MSESMNDKSLSLINHIANIDLSLIYRLYNLLLWSIGDRVFKKMLLYT